MVAADQLSGGCSFVHFRTGRLKPARGNLDRSTCAVHVLLRAPRGTPKSGSGSGSPVPAGALAQLPHVLSVCCDSAPRGGLKRIQRDWNGFRIRLAFRAFPVKDAAPLSFLNQPGKRFDSRRLRQESHFEKSIEASPAFAGSAWYFSAILKAFLKSHASVRSAMRKFEPIFLRKSRILSGFSC